METLKKGRREIKIKISITITPYYRQPKIRRHGRIQRQKMPLTPCP
jgi:hypothetical protein